MATSLLVESWVWYALGVFIVFARLISRALLFRSIKKLKIDDWMMLATIVPYTALLVTINIVSHTSSNLIMPVEDVSTFSQKDIANRVYGSKLVMVVEQMQCITVWMLKGSFIFLYYRLTVNLGANIAVKCLGWYMGVSFIIMEILYLGVWCRPFHNYWAVPTPNTQCSAATNHLITNAVFNLSSDVIMLGIGLSLFVRSTLPLNRKIILCSIFSMGIFVILASVLNKYYSFTHPFGSQWTFWYVRESSTGILVANMPFLWTLLRRMFKLEAF
ncbi:UbiD family decarboxylase, partial [Tothia fuscella]